MKTGAQIKSYLISHALHINIPGFFFIHLSTYWLGFSLCVNLYQLLVNINFKRILSNISRCVLTASTRSVLKRYNVTRFKFRMLVLFLTIR